MGKRELWKINKRLEHVEASLAELRDTIHQYFTGEEQTILMYEASIGRERSILEELDENEVKDYALSCQSYLDFGGEVDACMEGGLDRRTAVCMGRIPAVLEKTGCGKKNMYITQRHLRHILHDSATATSHYHNIAVRQMRQLPELLGSPLAVLSSERKPDTIVAVLDAKDQNGNQLIVPIKRNGRAYYQGKHVEANFILTVYGKRNIIHYLEKNVANGNVLFMDKKVSTNLGKVPLRLRQFLNDGAYINIIHQTAQDVNIPGKKTDGNRTEGRDIPKAGKDMKL